MRSAGSGSATAGDSARTSLADSHSTTPSATGCGVKETSAPLLIPRLFSAWIRKRYSTPLLRPITGSNAVLPVWPDTLAPAVHGVDVNVGMLALRYWKRSAHGSPPSEFSTPCSAAVVAVTEVAAVVVTCGATTSAGTSPGREKAARL